MHISIYLNIYIYIHIYIILVYSYITVYYIKNFSTFYYTILLLAALKTCSRLVTGNMQSWHPYLVRVGGAAPGQGKATVSGLGFRV